MKTIELKHLSPYLPYGLRGNAIAIDWDIEEINQELFRIETGKTKKENDNYEPFLVVGDSEIGLDGFKPILHPLSDLTKPIKVEGYNEGKEFVPMDELQRIEPEYPLMIDEGSVFFQDACDINMLEISRINHLFQLLYSWHFAIDIPEGCWIDINTL